MKKAQCTALLTLLVLALSLSGCRRCSDDLWDDTRSAGRHMYRGLRSLGGKHGESRQVRAREEFLCQQGAYYPQDFQAMEFEPFPDQDYTEQSRWIEEAERAEEFFNATVPGIEVFKDPSLDPELSSIFKRINFPYNSSLVKGNENLAIIRAIATYVQEHPNFYLFVEGHCDERGAEAYNLALGSKRSNAVRNLLIKEGAPAERVFTVSYGKERPLDLGHSEIAWALNRRAEFRVYEGR